MDPTLPPPNTTVSPNDGARAAGRNQQSRINNQKCSQDPLWVRVTLIGAEIGIMTLLVVVPVVSVFAEAFSDGMRAYWRNLTADPDTRHAVLVTLTVAPIAVLCNVVFGVAAA